MRALNQSGLKTLIVCGGVSANKRLRNNLTAEGQKRGYKVVFPSISLCTDNGAMIAGIAQIRKSANDLPIMHKVVPYLPLE